MGSLKLIADLNSIVRLQSDIIDGLYSLVAQYAAQEELEQTQIWRDMQTANALKTGIGGGGNDSE